MEGPQGAYAGTMPVNPLEPTLALTVHRRRLCLPLAVCALAPLRYLCLCASSLPALGRPLNACGVQVLIFFSSLFGDLIESIMKRDAGMKVGSFLSCRVPFVVASLGAASLRGLPCRPWFALGG